MTRACGVRHVAADVTFVDLTLRHQPSSDQPAALQMRRVIRRPVDYAERRAVLARLDEGWLPPVDADGAAKLLVTSRLLRLRREHPSRFAEYTPIGADGPAADHVVAFSRGGVTTVATRLSLRLAEHGGWKSTTVTLPEGRLVDVLTGRELQGGEVRLAALLEQYPVAVLTRPDLDHWHLGERVVRVPWRVSTGSMGVTRDAVLSGLGLALVPEVVVGRDLAEGRLVRLLPGYAAPAAQATALYPRSVVPSGGLRALMAALTDAGVPG